jgi:hypothetical protein
MNFLCTKNDKSKKGVKRTVPLFLPSIGIKYLEINSAKTVVRKNTRSPAFPPLKSHYTATVRKWARCCQKDRHSQRWDRIESPEISPFHFRKGCQAYTMGRE